jgi:hypothetical protein
MVEIGTDELNQSELNQMLISCTSVYQEEAEQEVTKIKKDEAQWEVTPKIGTEELN